MRARAFPFHIDRYHSYSTFGGATHLGGVGDKPVASSEMCTSLFLDANVHETPKLVMLVTMPGSFIPSLKSLIARMLGSNSSICTVSADRARFFQPCKMSFNVSMPASSVLSCLCRWLISAVIFRISSFQSNAGRGPSFPQWVTFGVHRRVIKRVFRIGNPQEPGTLFICFHPQSGHFLQFLP